MKEMLGDHNEWGIVTENDDEALYQGIKRLIDDPALLSYYKEKPHNAAKHSAQKIRLGRQKKCFCPYDDKKGSAP